MTSVHLHIAVAVRTLDKMGGKERDALAVAGGLAARGYKVTILTGSARIDPPAAVAMRVFGDSGWTNHGRAKRFTKAVAAAQRAKEFDLILSFEKAYAADFYYAADVCFACRMQGIKRWLPRYKTYAKIEADCFASGGPTIMFLCGKQRAEYLGRYRIESDRVVVLPPMIHVAEDQDFYAERTAVRREFHIPNNVPLAVSVAVYFRQKGVDRTIAALASVPELQLLVLGLKDIEPVRALARHYGVLDRTHLHGQTKDVMRFLGAADIMLHPARVENTGLVILESLLAGVPVIASGACGFAEYIERFGAGIVLDEPFDAAALVESIRTVIAPDKLSVLKNRARNSAPLLRAEGGLERILDVIERMMHERQQDRTAASGAA